MLQGSDPAMEARESPVRMPGMPAHDVYAAALERCVATLGVGRRKARLTSIPAPMLVYAQGVRFQGHVRVTGEVAGGVARDMTYAVDVCASAGLPQGVGARLEALAADATLTLCSPPPGRVLERLDEGLVTERAAAHLRDRVRDPGTAAPARVPRSVSVEPQLSETFRWPLWHGRVTVGAVEVELWVDAVHGEILHQVVTPVRRRARGKAGTVVGFGMLLMVGLALMSRWGDPDPHPPGTRFLTDLERGSDAEDLRPWFGIVPNLLVSPLALGGRNYVVQTSVPRVTGHLVHPLPPLEPSPHRALRVGPGGYATLNEAYAAARSGDTVRIARGVWPLAPMVVGRDVAIVGEPGAVLACHSERVPCIRIDGVDTRITLASVELRSTGGNGNLLGDPNPAWEAPMTAVRPHVRLVDVVMASTSGAAIMASAPGNDYEIVGGRFEAGFAFSHAHRVVMRPSARGAVVLLPGRGLAGGVTGTTVLLNLAYVDEAVFDRVAWSAVFAGDLAIDGSVDRLSVRDLVPYRTRIVLRGSDWRARSEWTLPPGGGTLRLSDGVVYW